MEILAFYDASDCHIYGRKHRRMLEGELADEAKSVGCAVTVYQTVLWFCFVFVPVWPLGTYIVMPFADYDESLDEALRYRGIRTTTDGSQVASYYLMMASLIAAAGITVWYWL